MSLKRCSFYLNRNVDIEAQIADIQSKKKELAASQASEKGVGLLESGYYDSELYDDGGADKKKRFEGYNTSIAANDDVDDDDDEGLPITKRTTYTAPKSILKDVIKQVNILVLSIFPTTAVQLLLFIDLLIRCSFFVEFQSEKDESDPFADRRRPTIADREDEYRQKRRRFVISPDRVDPFADG